MERRKNEKEKGKGFIDDASLVLAFLLMFNILINVNAQNGVNETTIKEEVSDDSWIDEIPAKPDDDKAFDEMDDSNREVNLDEISKVEDNDDSDSVLADNGIKPLLEGTADNPFLVEVIYHLAVTWENGIGETVYSWTRDDHTTSDNNSNQTTIDNLSSGKYKVTTEFIDRGNPVVLLE